MTNTHSGLLFLCLSLLQIRQQRILFVFHLFVDHGVHQAALRLPDLAAAQAELVDLTTGELSVVELVRRVEVGLDAKPVFHTQAKYRDLCLYVPATNRGNAMKKVRRILRDSNYEISKLFNRNQWRSK